MSRDVQPEPPIQQDVLVRLELRLGQAYLRQRLGIEQDHEDTFRNGTNLLHPENSDSVRGAIRTALRLSGMYARGRRNTERIRVLRNVVRILGLPSLFEGFTILQISDLHVDLNPGAMDGLISLLDGLNYDICVLTGDFRGETFGPFDAALKGLARVRYGLKELVFGILGNHDSIRMVPAIEEMGIRMLLNELEVIERGDQRLYLAGVDDGTTTRRTTSKKHPPRFHKMDAPSCSHTPPRSTARPPTQALSFSCAGTLTGARFACPAPFRCPSSPTCRDAWDRARGLMPIWPATLPLALAPASFPCASIALRKSRCTLCNKPSDLSLPNVGNSGSQPCELRAPRLDRSRLKRRLLLRCHYIKLATQHQKQNSDTSCIDSRLVRRTLGHAPSPLLRSDNGLGNPGEIP